MEFLEYQRQVLKFKGLYKNNMDQIINGVMGLTGEAGEVIDIVKKHLYQGHDLNVSKIIDELGDVLWYINLTAISIGVDLEDIATHNINKLNKRYPRGYFTRNHSVYRSE